MSTFDNFKTHNRNAKCKTVMSTSRVKESIFCSLLILCLNTGWNICPQQQVLTHTFFPRGQTFTLPLFSTSTSRALHSIEEMAGYLFLNLMHFHFQDFAAIFTLIFLLQIHSVLDHEYVLLSSATETPQILQDCGFRSNILPSISFGIALMSFLTTSFAPVVHYRW